MKKTIISAILATTFAGMVFAAGAPVASAANLATPIQGTTQLEITPGTVTLDTVPSFNYGTVADVQTGTSNSADGSSTIKVTDLRGAQLAWYVTAGAGDLLKGGDTSVKLPVATISMAVAGGSNTTGSLWSNIYSSDSSNTAMIAHGGTTTTATTQTGAISSTLSTVSSTNLQTGNYTGNITYTLVDSDPTQVG